MTALYIIAFTILNLLIIDMLVGLLIRHTRTTNDYRPAGLLTLLALALAPRDTIMLKRPLALTRFFLCLSASVFISSIIAVSLSMKAEAESDEAMLMLTLMPLLIMPLVHLIFGLLGSRPLGLMASIKNFRLRGVVALVIGASIILAGLGPQDNKLTFAIYALFAFLGLLNVFYLLSSLRAKSTFFFIDSEDSDVGPTGFLYYLCGLLELLFYGIVIDKELLSHLWSLFALDLHEYIRALMTIALLYVASFVMAKLFIVHRNALNVDFYERRLLPGSFLLFAVAMIFEHYW